jgi:hypothetical protein
MEARHRPRPRGRATIPAGSCRTRCGKAGKAKSPCPIVIRRLAKGRGTKRPCLAARCAGVLWRSRQSSTARAGREKDSRCRFCAAPVGPVGETTPGVFFAGAAGGRRHRFRSKAASRPPHCIHGIQSGVTAAALHTRHPKRRHGRRTPYTASKAASRPPHCIHGIQSGVTAAALHTRHPKRRHGRRTPYTASKAASPPPHSINGPCHKTLAHPPPFDGQRRVDDGAALPYNRAVPPNAACAPATRRADHGRRAGRSTQNPHRG